MTTNELLARLEARVAEAERMHSTAPVAEVLRFVVAEMQALGRNGDGTSSPSATITWRERLWTCPPETRLGVSDVAEAFGRPRSWVYRAVAEKRGPHRLHARRLGGELVFEAGEVRLWIERMEEG
ncbi:MAG TPA: hypothetical protein VJ816_04320 [Gemmatimonadales bacterium]|nr:hypothetical protein [Gemmatimonadales bacterium]